MYDKASVIQDLVSKANKIVVIQADNPDADSLGSALGLEQILGDQNKAVSLYCAVDIPAYLRYLPGWDRVTKELPAQFDVAIIVDASTMTLLEKLSIGPEMAWLKSRPVIVLDHHEIVENTIDFAAVTINDPARSSTGELIYLLAKDLGWPLSLGALQPLMSSILGDTQGLTNQLAGARTYQIMAEMVEAGVDRPSLEEMRRELAKMTLDIFRYKAELMKRTEFAHYGQIAHVSIPQAEINKYSPLYNPAPLIQGDMLQTAGVRLAIVFKCYSDGKVTGAIRSNPGAPVAAELAEHFGGGGHKFASGFKVVSSPDFNELKRESLKVAGELLDKMGKQ